MIDDITSTKVYQIAHFQSQSPLLDNFDAAIFNDRAIDVSHPTPTVFGSTAAHKCGLHRRISDRAATA